jgi:DNA-binding response OmpR family regulator
MLQADRDEPLTTISRGPLLLDPAAHLVSLDGEPVELSRTEFNLLHLLLRNPGRTFSRAYLLDMVWGETYFVGDCSVDNMDHRFGSSSGSATKRFDMTGQ